ncbi:MAG: helix-turn-helix transcriptional regulator [Clostridia bacterium]|nr:helix-turn-helix transcriptional regulator [Clostridia bacterium]
MSIASALSQALKRQGITQSQLAKQVGITPSYISQICAGKRVPTISTLERIGGCLNMSVEDFLGGEGEPAVQSEQVFLTGEETHLLACYRSMNRKSRKAVCLLAEQLRR